MKKVIKEVKIPETTLDAEILSVKEFESVIAELAQIEGLPGLLSHVMKKDMLNYFQVPKESQDMIRGGYNRTEWLLKFILKAKSAKVKLPPAKMKSPRHA